MLRNSFELPDKKTKVYVCLLFTKQKTFSDFFFKLCYLIGNNMGAFS